MANQTEMKQGEIKIAVLQPDILWKDIPANLANYSRMLDSLPAGSDLILLPEMFSTGFTLDPEPVAEEMDGMTLNWLAKMARKHDCTLAGSVVIKEKGRFYNRLVCMQESGIAGTYDKRHLFRMEGEEKNYTAGTKKLIIPLNGWRISFQICYDLRFPVWSRNRNDYDMMVYVANWPAVRSEVWNTLLKARAIENQSYVVGVNRTGRDGNGILYKGDTQVVDPKGKVALNLGTSTDQMAILTLSLRDVLQFREKFPAWHDGDDFELR